MVGQISYCGPECRRKLKELRDNIRKLEQYKLKKRELARRRIEQIKLRLQSG